MPMKYRMLVFDFDGTIADTLGETVADAYHFTRRYIQQGIAGFHVEDERNPKHSRHVNGLISIADQQARIDAAVRARTVASSSALSRRR